MIAIQTKTNNQAAGLGSGHCFLLNLSELLAYNNSVSYAFAIGETWAINISENNSSVTFEVRVIPRSSKSEIVGEYNGALKVKLKSPPVDGSANEELMRLLSNEFRVSRTTG